MKNFQIFLEDKQNNTLDIVVITAKDKKDAKRQANILLANSKINDLDHVIIK